MKALIATTCVALLAAVGYFFYGEYAEAQARTERAAERAALLREVYSDARAEPGEAAKVMKHCDFVRDSVSSKTIGDYAKVASARCSAAGF
jgi:hypothetical protein